jgi:hypothetical protein
MQDDLSEHQQHLIDLISRWEQYSSPHDIVASLSYCTPGWRAKFDIQFINSLGFYHAHASAEFFGLFEIVISRVKINTVDQ